jgi:hypothetical protein
MKQADTLLNNFFRINKPKGGLYMACEIIRTDGAVLYVKISGVMLVADQQFLQSEGLKLIKQGGKARLLVTFENFQGWEKGADWGDVGFMIAHGNDIDKIAIIGNEIWKDDAFAFLGKGLRTTQIEFFSPSSLKEADSWIRS